MLDVVVASNWSSALLEPTLRFWSDTLGMACHFTWDPVPDLLHSLNNPASTVSQQTSGYTMLFISALMAEEHWGEIAALVSATVPCLMVICPVRGYEHVAPPGRHGLIIVSPQAILAECPAETLYHPTIEHRAILPYTSMGHTAIATVAMRHLAQWVLPAFKVIAVDADNTLWRGITAEDGIDGVQPEADLHQLLVQKQQAGAVLAVCSRNQEADVRAVFERPDMRLRPHHISAWCVHEGAKSDSLRCLAETLALPPDAIIFLDDDPLEIAEVEQNLPGVLAVHLPPTGERAEFLRALWALDGPVGTQDAWRTTAYQEHMQREGVRAASRSVEEFIDGLQLQVRSHPMQPHQRERVAQLTERTHQMNLNPVARSLSDLTRREAEGYTWLATTVRDRFGDYGLVGAVEYRMVDSTLQVESFMLSCRALRRGVEHRMLKALGTLASDAGCSFIQLNLAPTSRNSPAQAFVSDVSATLTPAAARAVRYRPAVPAPEAPSAGARPMARPPYRFIATSLSRIADIHTAVLKTRQQRPSLSTPYRAPATADETAVVAIFEELLRVQGVGADDSFWDLGGYSLLAVQLLARIESDLARPQPVEIIFRTRLSPAELARTDALTAATEQVATLSDEEVERLLVQLS